MSWFRSTAITTSAPSARATLTGTGLTRPPSTSRRPLLRTGVTMPGTAMLARTASVSSPLRATTSAPVSQSVATAAKGSARSSISAPGTCARTNSATRWPSISPERGNTGSSSATMPAQSRLASRSAMRSILPDAYTAPTTAPMLVPATQCTLMPASCSARSTPMCASPRAEPLPSATPTRGWVARAGVVGEGDGMVF